MRFPDPNARKLPPPDLGDPQERAAYHQELRGVASGLRRGGIFITLAGTLMVALHRTMLPSLPVWVGALVVGWGVLLMGTAIVFRSAYHRRRMRGEG